MKVSSFSLTCFYLCFLIYLISCDESTNNSLPFSNFDKNNQDNIQINKIDLSKPFDVNRIKRINKHGTSTIINQDNYYRPINNKGFYGMYYLVDERDIGIERKYPVFATMVVFNSGDSNNWFYNDTTETLIQISTADSLIKFYGSFAVGDSVDLVIDLLGSPNIDSKNFIAYYQNNILLKIEKEYDKIIAIDYGKYDLKFEIDSQAINILLPDEKF